jgi:hypothetical protein
VNESLFERQTHLASSITFVNVIQQWRPFCLPSQQIRDLLQVFVLDGNAQSSFSADNHIHVVCYLPTAKCVMKQHNEIGERESLTLNQAANNNHHESFQFYLISGD